MAKKEANSEMSLEEARAYRASLYVPQKTILSDSEKENLFKIYWAQNRKQYGKPKELEPLLWVHLKATGNDQPEKFEAGIAHFGLEKIR